MSIRNTKNGNSHRFENLEWEQAEKLFLEATRRGLAACIFQEWTGYDSFWDGIYLAQNKKHADFEREFCC